MNNHSSDFIILGVVAVVALGFISLLIADYFSANSREARKRIKHQRKVKKRRMSGNLQK